MCQGCGCHGASSVNLDDLSQLKQHDVDDMLGLTLGLPEQLRKAHELASAVKLPDDYAQVRNIIATGMGGSGIGGALTAKLFEDELKVPMAFNRDYTLPAYVGSETLVIAASYSGNTEETLTAANIALERGAKVFCITSGGALGELAEAKGLPWVQVPTGLAPRAASGYMLVPSIMALVKLGLIPSQEEAFAELFELTEALREDLQPEVKFAENPAKQLADQLCGHIPLIYGEIGYLGLVAERWKTQLNENSKMLAYSNVLPELNHNEVVGWTLPDELAEVFSVVFLRDKDANVRYQLRAEVTKQLIVRKGCHLEEVWTRGHSKLAKLFSVSYFGDFVSVYLAALYEVDPGSIDNIKLLKAKLAEAGPVAF